MAQYVKCLSSIIGYFGFRFTATDFQNLDFKIFGNFFKFTLGLQQWSYLGIYGAAVVPDSGVGNTWQHLTLVLHEFLSNGVMVMGGRIMVMGGYQIYVCMSVWDTDTTEWI